VAALLWLIAGLLWPLLLPALPGFLPGIVVLSACLALALYTKKPLLLLLLCGTMWSFLHLHERLDQRLDPGADYTIVLRGHVSNFPVIHGDMLEFRFSVSDFPARGRTLKKDLLVRWYRDWPEIVSGDYWQLGLQLKPARSRVNFAGPDREKWYFSEGISALAVVDSGNSKFLGNRGKQWTAMRQGIRESVMQILAGHPSRGLVLALALADRSEIPAAHWSRFRITGTSHLLAISGMHVGLAAMLGFWLARILLALLPSRLALGHGILISWCFSLALAAWYSIMAGLGTSTQRALIMLLTLAMVRLLHRNAGAWPGYLLALAVVMLLNPLAPLGAGFWFSFTAVAVLFAVLKTRYGQRHWLSSAMLVQSGLTLVMFPLGMLWFQQITMLGLFSNLVAIPWISISVVPATLLSIVLMPLNSAVTPFLLYTAAESLLWLSAFLAWLEQAGSIITMMTPRPGLLAVSLATAGGFVLLLPRGLRARSLGLLLLVPLFIPEKRGVEGGLRVEMLDVGQGFAALVETDGHLLLYDSGPGDGSTWSLVSTAIAPAIVQAGMARPDLAIISHGDLDHAGGLHDLQIRYPAMEIMANLRNPGTGVPACLAPLRWNWDDVRFEILHPRIGLPYLGNDSSCVLSLSLGDQRVLLTGDISQAVEQRLVNSGLEPHQVLFAPHHGSKSSSGAGFIASVQPEFSLVSAAHLNRFGFPHSKVTDRFEKHGIGVWSSADCGAIELTYLGGHSPQFASARRRRNAIWRWQAEAYCP
jgi:competence protein ComEC